MTIVYFVRHAEPNYDNHDDLKRELTPKGKEDSKLVTKFMLKKPIDVILSSPYKRAVDTLSDLSLSTNLPIITIEDFKERKIDSIWIENFTSFAKQQWLDFNYKLTDGESLGEVQKRNIAALQKVLKQYTNKKIVIGSHGTALSTIINYYDPSFDYDHFEAIRLLMPWIVQFTFDGEKCIAIEYFNVFQDLSY